MAQGWMAGGQVLQVWVTQLRFLSLGPDGCSHQYLNSMLLGGWGHNTPTCAARAGKGTQVAAMGGRQQAPLWRLIRACGASQASYVVQVHANGGMDSVIPDLGTVCSLLGS